MTIKQTKIGWGFWLKWVLATTVGFSISIFILHILFSVVGEMLGDIPDNSFIAQLADNMLFTLAVYLIPAGAGAGIIQWLILRRRVSRVGWWAPAMVAGFFLAFVLLYALSITFKGHYTNMLPEHIMPFVFLALGGTLAGVFQWFFMRKHISQAGWWVLASAVGWSLGTAVWRLGDWFLYEWVGFRPGGLFEFLHILNASGLLFGIIMGAVTGGALVWLLRQPVNVK